MRQLTFSRTVGAGAFGTVYQAELHSGRGFRRQVAVKVIQASGPDGAMFLSRIRDEARLLGLLQDDAILKVLDMVQVEGRDAVVMEFVEGVDLDSLIQHQLTKSSRALAELGATVAGALFRAHTATNPADGSPLGVVHRDVKPANIMITRSGGVRLLDFGIARARFDARESHTGQLVLGTLLYMAPEYIVANTLSPAADLFGLGLCLYEAAAGEVYGQPKVRQDSHERRLAERLHKLSGTHPDLVPALQRLLAWDPDARPDGRQAERMLWEIAGRCAGPGLRQWASSAVPQVLAARQVTEDRLGLVGRTITLGSTPMVTEDPADVAVSPPQAREPQRATRSPLMPPDPGDIDVPPSASLRSATPAPTPPSRPPRATPAPVAPAPAPPARSTAPSPPPTIAALTPQATDVSPPPTPAADDARPGLLSSDVVKGVLIGGVVGVVLLGLLSAALLALSP